jgi:GT2 family glycosyltransferase
MRLLIVIVNYRTPALVLDCLRSLQSEIDPSSMRVVVTDNKSDDDSPQIIGSAIERNWRDWASMMPLARNAGFSAGNNAAIEAALQAADSPEYVLLLNPDTIVREGAIGQLLSFMDARPDVGIAGSRLEDPDGTVQRSAFRFPGLASEFERGIRIGIVTRLLKRWMLAPPAPDEPAEADWVAGASMIIRRKVFAQVPRLDDKYFMYFEEVDFCLAARRAGWKCWYVPSSRVVHLVGAASQLSDQRKHRQRRPTYWFDSRRRYFVKNHGVIYAGLADIAFAAGFALWRLRRAIQRKDDPDPPKMLADFIRNSVFVRGTAV